MKKAFFLVFILFINSLFAQEYNSVIIDKDSIDINNRIYKLGSVFIYDYEIIKNDKKYKLKTNYGRDFSLTPIITDSIGVQKIHLTVNPLEIGEKRINSGQTQISYYQGPEFLMSSSTGVVDNKDNVWIHPIRVGFFNALETCPFPYIKKPYKKGNQWKDKMIISENWSYKLWGDWSGKLLLNYHHEIIGKEKLQTKFGKIDCYVINSNAKSRIGETKLISYFSEKYGFVRLEYELVTGIKINFWLVDFKENQVFNSIIDYFKTKKYIKD